MYFKNELVEKINILPQELRNFRNDITNNIDQIVLDKLKDKLGDKCLRYGLIKKDSIDILSRSVCYFNNGQFNSSLCVKVRFIAEICNPLDNQIIECKVSSQNKMGILAYIGDNLNLSPLIILLAKQHHLNNEIFKNIKTDDIIRVKVVGKKFDINDKQISIIGSLVTDKNEDNMSESIDNDDNQDEEDEDEEEEEDEEDEEDDDQDEQDEQEDEEQENIIKKDSN